MIRYARNENGMALVMSLVLAVITLAFSAALIFMVTQGSKMSGMEKRYATALDAAKGGLEALTESIDQGGSSLGTWVEYPSKIECLVWKLRHRTIDYPGGCGANARTLNPTIEEDMRFDLGEEENTYRIRIKIIDTVAGNTLSVSSDVFTESGDEVSVNKGGGEINVQSVVEGGAFSTSIVSPMTVPYLYTALIFAQRIDPNTFWEKDDATATLKVLYGH